MELAIRQNEDLNFLLHINPPKILVEWQAEWQI